MWNATRKMAEELKKAGFEIINDGIREMWNPDEVEENLISGATESVK